MALLVVQRPCRMILCSAAPARAAVVAKPERSECPLNSSGARPAVLARRLSLRAVPSPDRRSGRS